jgi:hypothetical protein
VAPLWEPRSSAKFEEQFDRLREADQTEVLRAVQMISIDPMAYGEVKHLLEEPEGEGRLVWYDLGHLWITYKILGNHEYLLMSCGRLAHR